MYVYHNTRKNLERLELRRDHCQQPHDSRVHDIGRLLVDGHVRDPRDLDRLLTTAVLVPGGPGKWIFAMGLDRTIRIAADSERGTLGAIKHETLYHNADVLAAGEVCFESGILVDINDASGTYEGILSEFALDVADVMNGLRVRMAGRAAEVLR